MLDYFELLTDVPGEELADIRRSLEGRSVNPMEIKMRLAREIVGQFHGREAARGAEEEFNVTYSTRTIDVGLPLPKGTVPVRIPFGGPWLHADIAQVLFQAGLAKSLSEARRLIDQGAVERIGHCSSLGNTFSRPSLYSPTRLRRSEILYDGEVIRVGKHRFLRIVDADKQ